MLTKHDLNSIGGLIATQLKPIQDDIKDLKTDVVGLKNDVKELKVTVSALQKDVTVVKKDVKKVKKIIEKDFGYHEKHNIHVAKNVQQIQRHLGMPVMTIDPLDVNSFL